MLASERFLKVVSGNEQVQVPTITVETNWPGASPQEVEQEIVIEQEEQLTSVESLTRLFAERVAELQAAEGKDAA